MPHVGDGAPTLGVCPADDCRARVDGRRLIKKRGLLARKIDLEDTLKEPPRLKKKGPLPGLWLAAG